MKKVTITFEQLPEFIWSIKEQLAALSDYIYANTKTQAPLPPSNDKEYITRKEAAAKLHISLPTLDSYSQEGKLKAYRLGSRVLYKANEIEQALRAIRPSTIG